MIPQQQHEREQLQLEEQKQALRSTNSGTMGLVSSNISSCFGAGHNPDQDLDANDLSTAWVAPEQFGLDNSSTLDATLSYGDANNPDSDAFHMGNARGDLNVCLSLSLWVFLLCVSFSHLNYSYLSVLSLFVCLCLNLSR